MLIPEWLDHFDKMLLLLIQHDSDHAWLDRILPVLRDAYTWIPLYLFILYAAWRKAGWNCWSFVVLSLLTFAITDSVSAQLLKPWFARPRPCHDAELSSVIRELIDCGGVYSMPSSHASNHFGLAAFWYFSFKVMDGRKWKWLWLWAALVCYAQVYVGKHYPSDVLLGGILGTVTGMGMALVFTHWWNRSGVFRKYLLI